MRKLSAFAGKVRQVIIVCALAALGGPAQAATNLYVATTGSDSNDGTNNPVATLTRAVSLATAGDTIYMHGGTYNLTAKISLSKIGTAANPYRIRAYAGEHPSINCSAVGSNTDGFSLTGAYWQLYGLEIYGAPHNAIRVQGSSTAGAGSHNTIEFCSFHDCGNTGFSIGASTTPTTYLAGSNLVLNCDSYRNFDPNVGGNADGFSVKYQVGPDNNFVGCRAWENSDDGWDLFGAIGRVLIDTCWTWRNGSNVWGAAYNSTFDGNGNGFKMGGNFVAAPHRLVRSVAYQNWGRPGKGGKGIDQNNNTGSLTIDNNTSWGNRVEDINMNTTPTTTGTITLRNNLVISGTANIQSSATQISNSWQVISSPAAGTNDVLSLDASLFISPRQADGSLPITVLVHPVPNGRLVDKGVNIGEPFNGSAPDLGAYETAGGVAAPVAAFTGTPTNGAAPLAVTFTDSSSGSITNRFWNFGDSSTTNTTTNSLSHAYNAGTYTVSLTVSGSGGTNTSTRSSYIVALNPAHLVVNPGSLNFGSVTTGQTNSLNFSVINTGEISLTGTASSGSPFLITNGGSYTVGGGQTQTVTVGFAPGSAGTFNGSVIFASTGGNSTNAVSGTGAIAPVASFAGSPTSGTEPLLVTLTDTSTGTITNRFWNFGDSTTANVTTSTVAHTYSAGTYPVTLVVVGPAGVSTNIQANYITVLTAFQAWQVQYFGSTSDPSADSNADPDGDGMSNQAEFLAGTDPTNSVSSLRITGVVRTNADVAITWTTGPGKTNALQATAGAGDGSYQTNNFSDIFTVTNTIGSSTNYLDVGAATNNPSRYYRIRLVP